MRDLLPSFLSLALQDMYSIQMHASFTFCDYSSNSHLLSHFREWKLSAMVARIEKRRRKKITENVWIHYYLLCNSCCICYSVPPFFRTFFGRAFFFFVFFGFSFCHFFSVVVVFINVIFSRMLMYAPLFSFATDIALLVLKMYFALLFVPFANGNRR